MLPEVPTLAESGVAGYDSAVWWGFVAPSGIPEPVARKLNADIVKVLKSESVRAKIEEGGAVVIGESAAAFRQLIAAEQQKWGPVIKAAGIRAE